MTLNLNSLLKGLKCILPRGYHSRNDNSNKIKNTWKVRQIMFRGIVVLFVFFLSVILNVHKPVKINAGLCLFLSLFPCVSVRVRAQMAESARNKKIC